MPNTPHEVVNAMQPIPGTPFNRMCTTIATPRLSFNEPNTRFATPILRSILCKLSQVKWNVPAKAMSTSKCLPSTRHHLPSTPFKAVNTKQPIPGTPFNRMWTTIASPRLPFNLPSTRFATLTTRFIRSKTPL